MRKVSSHSRRGFIRAGVSGASLAVTGAGAAQGEKQKVLYAELLPHEFRTRLTARPIAYLPLGTLEWHGEHLPLASDPFQSEGLMIECARRFGGIVMPPSTSVPIAPDPWKMAACCTAWTTLPLPSLHDNWTEAATGFPRGCTC